MRIDRLKIFLDSMGGGAWPFLVGGVICLVNSDNERDLNLLISNTDPLLVSASRLACTNGTWQLGLEIGCHFWVYPIFTS